MFYEKIRDYGNRVKAWYILSQYCKKHKDKESKSLQNWAFMKLNYSPEIILKNVIQKMIRCADMSLDRAMLVWKMECYQTKDKKEQLKKSSTI